MRKRKIIGLQRKKVKLVSYSSEWKKLYRKEEKLLRNAVKKYLEDIQHIGGTAISGVKAKPIIDIIIGVKRLKNGKKLIKPLKKLGYEYKKNAAGIKGRHFFTKGSEKNRTYYIHIAKLNGRFWKNCIVFRDYLREQKRTVEAYNELKEELAKKYKDNRDKYTAKKSYFIQKIIKKAEKH